MGTAISSQLQSNDGLDWCGCVEIAENAMEHDLITLKTLFTKLSKNGYLPNAVFTSFKRSIDVYFVYDFAQDDLASWYALTEFNQLLIQHGLVTSILPTSTRRSAHSGYRHRIENATLIVFCLTRRYVDRINDHTRTFPCQSEFHYLSSRKSFLKLFPVVFESIDDEEHHHEDDHGDVLKGNEKSGISSGGMDWNNEVCEGPVAVLLGGRSTWSHWPVQHTHTTNTDDLEQTTLQITDQNTSTSVHGTTAKYTMASAPRSDGDTPQPLPLHELARQGLARQVFHACVRAFVDNAHRAILLQDMTRWLREHVPAMPPSKHLPLALSFLDNCDCGTMGRVARKVIDDASLLTQAGVNKYDQEILLAALLDEEILPTSYLIHAAEQRRKYVTTGVLLTHSELGMSPPTSPRKTQERQLKLREKVTKTIYQKRVQRDEFLLRGVYAGEEEEQEEGEEEEETSSTRLPVLSSDHSHKTTHGDSHNKPRNQAINSNNSNSNKGNASSRPYSAGARSSSSTKIRASSRTNNQAGVDGMGSAMLTKPLTPTPHTVKQKEKNTEEEEQNEAMLTQSRLHHLVDVMQREVEEEWCGRYQRAVKELDVKLDAIHRDNRRLSQEAIDRDTLINSLEQENATLKKELHRWRAARGVLARHWERNTKERRRELLAIRYDDKEREKQAKEALEMPK